MSPITPPVASTTPPAAPAPAGDREQLKAAAKQFEAIFVRQMLSEARKASFGGDELFGSQGMDTFRQMQDERFADIASNRGAFGIARMLELQLAKQLPPDGSAGASTSSARAGLAAPAGLHATSAQPEPVEGPAPAPNGGA